VFERDIIVDLIGEYIKEQEEKQRQAF